MRALSVLFFVLWAVLVVYTIAVVGKWSVNLFPYFFGDIAKMGWPGQFNLDFMMMLFLSALWTGWRNQFDGLGIILAVVAFFGGAGFLLPYLGYLFWKHSDDPASVLIGASRRNNLT